MGSQLTQQAQAMITKVALVMLAIQLSGLANLTTGEAAASSLTEKCGGVIQQVMNCLSYATGKAAEPTKQCCDAVSGIKEKQPVCLCFFIGQVHNGSEQVKSLGVQEPKLLQLPSACQLSDASVTNCPKLLGISPTSPAAAIFMHSNATSPSSSSSTSTPTGNNSSAFKHVNGPLVSLVIAVFVSTFLNAPFTVGISEL